MTTYTDTIDLSTVSTAQILLWREILNLIIDTHNPQLLLEAGFTIPAAITHLETELTKRSLAQVYSRPLNTEVKP